jgi:hypothetical protein
MNMIRLQQPLRADLLFQASVFVATIPVLYIAHHDDAAWAV